MEALFLKIIVVFFLVLWYDEKNIVCIRSNGKMSNKIEEMQARLKEIGYFASPNLSKLTNRVIF